MTPRPVPPHRRPRFIGMNPRRHIPTLSYHWPIWHVRLQEFLPTVGMSEHHIIEINAGLSRLLISSVNNVIGRRMVKTHFNRLFCLLRRACKDADVKPGLAMFHGAFTDPIKRFRDSGFPAQIIEQGGQQEKRTPWLTVHSPIIRLAKISLSPNINDSVKVFETMADGQQIRERLRKRGGVIILPRMISPHQAEFHLFAIICFEKTAVQRLIPYFNSGIPVPIKNPCIDPMARSGFDFANRPSGIGFIEVSPLRQYGLTMSLETRLAAPIDDPFRPAEALPSFHKRRWVETRVVDASGREIQTGRRTRCP